MYPCKYRMPSSSSLDSCQKEKLLCTKKQGEPCACRCPRKIDPYETCKDNLRDITESVAKILIMVGIHPKIVKPTKQLIFALFHHYDYARWSLEPTEPTRICKEHILHLLMKVFDFKKIESELTYYVIKRAFKAYFNNKCKGFLNAALDTEITAQDTGAWRHAARTTARIIEKYEYFFPRLEHHYAKKILQIYFDMCESIRKRVDPLMIPYCPCKNCAAQKLPVNVDPTKDDLISDDFMNKKECNCGICARYKGGKLKRRQPNAPKTNKVEIFGINKRDCKGNIIPSFRRCVGRSTKRELVDEDRDCVWLKDPLPEIKGLPICTKCKTYKMICDCQDNGNRESQGPYETHWVRVYGDEEDEIIPGDIKMDPENHHCPVDCHPLSLMSDWEEVQSESESDVCHCCDGDESGEEESSTDEEARDANFVQDGCYCQKQEDIGI